MTNSNSSSSLYLEKVDLNNSPGLQEILKAMHKISTTKEEVDPHVHLFHHVHDHLFYGKDIAHHIHNQEVLDFLHGIHLMMKREGITTIAQLDTYIHNSKHAFKEKHICHTP